MIVPTRRECCARSTGGGHGFIVVAALGSGSLAQQPSKPLRNLCGYSAAASPTSSRAL